MDFERVARTTASTVARATRSALRGSDDVAESNDATQDGLVESGDVAPLDAAPSLLTGRQVGVLSNFGIGPENLDDEAQARMAHAIGRLDGMLACTGGDENACAALGPAPTSLSDASSADENEQEILLEEADYTLTLRVSTDPLTGETTSRLLYIDADGTYISGLSNQPVETLFAPEPEPELDFEAQPEDEGWLSTLAGIDADYDVLTRLGGAMQVAGGAADLAVAIPLLFAPEPVLTKVAAGSAGLRGLDDLQAGLQTVISGEPTETVTQTVATDAAVAMGADPESAKTIGLAVDMVTGILNPAGRLRHMTTEMSERLTREAAEQAGRQTDEAASAVKAAEEGASLRRALISPTGAVGDVPSGSRTAVAGSVETRRALTRENEAADILAANGYKVEQNPVTAVSDELRVGANPDYRVEGNVFDCYSPAPGTSLDRVRDAVSDKVRNGQTRSVVLNLADSPIQADELRFMLEVRKPVRGLEQVLVVRDGQVLQVYP